MAFGIGNIQLNIALVGDYKTGKTALIKRFSEKAYIEDPTVGEYVSVECEVPVSGTHTQNVKLMILDTSGMENGQALTSNFYRNKDGFILTWDIMNLETYKNLDNWEKSILALYNGDNMPDFIVVANKTDKLYDVKTSEIYLGPYKQCVENYKRKKISCFKTSALHGDNVDEAFNKLLSLMVDSYYRKQGDKTQTSGKVNLMADRADHPAQGNCC